MSKMLKWIAAAGTIVAGLGSVACAVIIIDEPTMPKSLIK